MFPIIVDSNLNLRRSNREDFVEKTEWSKKSDFCILILLYNNVDNVQWMINYLSSESHRDNIDLIIVDNSSVQQYHNLWSNSCNIAYIRPIQNLGSAWGYALGMEYLIDQWYEYFTMLEDDIILIDWEIFSETYIHRAKNQLIFMNACINAGWRHSRYVQYACYPVDFIRRVGIIDPRYFFRSEDLERKIRIERWIREYWYQKIILDKNHYRPYLKRVNGSASWSYFSLRNQFFMIQQHFSFVAYIVLNVTIFLYLWNACVRSIFLWQYQYLAATTYAIYDFMIWNRWLDISQYRAQQFSKKYTIWVNEQMIDSSDFLTNYKLSLFFEKYMFSGIDISRLWQFKWFHGSSVLIWWWNVILYPVFIFFSSIVSIDEFVLGTDNIIISHYHNSYSLLKWLVALVIWFLLIPFCVGIIIILFLKYMIAWLQKND